MTRTHTLPAGTLATALAETGLITSGHAYFDPMDTLMDKLGDQPSLYARVAESLAWMLDASCISQARTILFNRYKDIEDKNAEAFSDLCLNIHADLSRESQYEEGSPEHTLAILLAMRNDWHDAASSAAASDDRDYNAKSLREQMLAEKPSKVSVGARVNLQALAKDEANGDEAKEKRIYADMLEADAISAAQRAEGNRSLMPTVLEILRTVQSYSSSDSRFDHLPLSKQRQLTTFTLGAIDRTLVDVAKRLASQPIAFSRAREAGRNAKLALEAVIASKYSDIGELESTGSPMSGTELEMSRNAKRKAICTID